MALTFLIAGLLAAGTAQSHVDGALAAATPTLKPGDRVVVTGDRQPIRGRVAAMTDDKLMLERDGARVPIDLAAVQQIDRLGDSLFNGTAIGAAIGGGGAIAAMAKACSNTNCADTSANLDPRIVLLGTAIGAGIGAIVDAAMDGGKTVYRAGQYQTLPPTSQRVSTPGGPHRMTLFGRVGWARFTDDEGSLGDGATVGVGVIVPFGRRFGLQVAYDRHNHRRDIGTVGPPEATSRGGFTGTEQLVTAKALFFFRSGQRVRPYAGIGVGFLDSTRVSEFPTFVSQPGRFPVPGPPQVFNYHTRGGGLGFAAGMDARLTERFSMLGDLTLDMNNPDALGSARLTVGAGWRF